MIPVVPLAPVLEASVLPPAPLPPSRLMSGGRSPAEPPHAANIIAPKARPSAWDDFTLLIHQLAAEHLPLRVLANRAARPVEPVARRGVAQQVQGHPRH